MPQTPNLAAYVDAFNRGDAAAYGAFYAPDVVLRNGGGTVLEGRDAIVQFYTGVRQRMHRVMRLLAVVEGRDSLAATLGSMFTALEDGVSLAGETLCARDRLVLESMALYELEDGKFVRIEATTVRHRVLRKGEGE